MCSSWRYPPPYAELFSSELHGKQKLLVTVPNRNSYCSWTVRSILSNRKSYINDNGAPEPARVFLDRFFTETRKFEKMSGDSLIPTDSQFGFHLGTLETDLQAALAALKKKEEDLENAERKILSEQSKINSAKEELVRREQDIASACLKQVKLEEELKLANLNLAYQASEIDDLKLQIKESEKEIRDAHSKLALKEDEINRMKSELKTKSELAVATQSDLEENVSLLKEANEIVKKQKVEIQQLQRAVQEKEDDLKVSASLRELEGEKVKVAEISLMKKTTEWLIAQDELKKLAAEASKHTIEVNTTAESFQRVKKLLTDVRSELLLSQEALISSRKKMEHHGLLLQKHFMELEEEKRSLVSYMENLKAAQLEIESEQVKLRVAEARNRKLEHDLSVEKDLVAQLQAQLEREKSLLEKEIGEKSFLQEQLDQESTKLGEAQSLLQAKELDLAEARLEIQQLKSEHDSLKFILEERDSELCDAKKNLEDVNKEIVELKTFMSSRENQLVQTENLLKEKEEHVQTMQLELNDAMLRYSEAETAVENFLELTNKMVNSVDNDNCVGSSILLNDLAAESKWKKKHLETELEIARESLKTKEMEVLAAQRALTMKEEELKQVRDKLEETKRDMKGMKDEMTQDANDLRQLHSLASERIGERSMGDLAIEKLQIEAAQLEAEAATTALYKLTEMSRKLCTSANSNFEATLLNSFESGLFEVDNKCLSKFKTEVSRLSALSERLVKEAGITDDMAQ